MESPSYLLTYSDEYFVTRNTSLRDPSIVKMNLTVVVESLFGSSESTLLVSNG